MRIFNYSLTFENGAFSFETCLNGVPQLGSSVPGVRIIAFLSLRPTQDDMKYRFNRY